MDDEARLEELLSQWQRTCEGGRPVSLPELCRDCPELLPELERCVRAMRRLENLVGGPDTPATADRSDADEQPTPAAEAGASCSTGVYGAANANANPPDPPTVAQPRFLGRYRVEALIGRGGFGQVVKAYDPVLQREVAIKSHRPERPRPVGWGENLLDEARKLAALKHPNIVPVYDAFADAGAVFIVSELIDGPDLRRHLEAGRRPLREAVALVAAVADALHHAHLHGIVHRDVKPSNVLLDSRGQPHLADFGLAVSEEEQLRERPTVLGTLAYMSPEQIRGDSHLVDARTDTYSLGVVLYETLTGRVPFKGTDPPDYKEQILRRPPRPPRTIDDSIPPELERICLKCLAKSVEDRYTTAADLAAELRAWLDRESPPPKARRTRWGLLVAAGAAVCLGLALLFAYRPWKAVPEPEEPGRHGNTAVPPKPGEWHNLLAEEPTLLFRPERFARQYDAEKKELWWDTKGECMIRLGTAPGEDYEIEVTFDQSTLAGHRGLFLGRPAAAAETPNVAECQFVVFILEPLRQKDVAIFRGKASVNEPAGKVKRLRRLGSEVSLHKASLPLLTLSVRVKAGRLVWVRVGHEPVEGLFPQKPGPEAPLTGDFGVFADAGACRLVKARLKAHQKED